MYHYAKYTQSDDMNFSGEQEVVCFVEGLFYQRWIVEKN